MKTLQNQSLDLKTFRDRFLLIRELFWSSFWLLKSIKTELKIKRFLEAILDAIFDDFAIDWGRPGGMREAAGGLNSLKESDKS